MTIQGVLSSLSGANCINNLSDLVQNLIILISFFLLSALSYYAIRHLKNKHKVLAKIINAFRNCINLLLMANILIIYWGYAFWLVSLLVNVVRYLAIGKSLSAIVPDAIHFGLFWFVKKVVEVLEIFHKNKKSLNYVKEYELTTPKSGKHYDREKEGKKKYEEDTSSK